MEDGVITFAASEERFTRLKLQDGFPWQAIQAAFSATGLDAGSVDRVVYPFFDSDQETALFRRNLDKEKAFMDEADYVSNALVRSAQSRVPRRTQQIPGLSEPNERMEIGRAHV